MDEEIKNVKVLLVEDDPDDYEFRKEELLESRSPRFEIVHAIRMAEAVSHIQEHVFDVVLLDIRMQKTDGLSALKRIREESPETRVMILSTYDNPTYVARSVAMGAKDYVLKGSSREVLLQRIRDVAHDKPPTEDSILHLVKETMAQRKNLKSDFPLTNRELQVLRHIALGLSNREIGTSLGISVETVKEHVQNILRKINAVDRTQAAVWAVKRGLIP